MDAIANLCAGDSSECESDGLEDVDADEESYAAFAINAADTHVTVEMDASPGLTSSF